MGLFNQIVPTYRGYLPVQDYDCTQSNCIRVCIPFVTAHSVFSNWKIAVIGKLRLIFNSQSAPIHLIPKRYSFFNSKSAAKPFSSAVQRDSQSRSTLGRRSSHCEYSDYTLSCGQTFHIAAVRRDCGSIDVRYITPHRVGWCDMISCACSVDGKTTVSALVQCWRYISEPSSWSNQLRLQQAR